MALPEAIRRILEARMQGYEYQSDFARKYYGQGREEGRQEVPLGAPHHTRAGATETPLVCPWPRPLQRYGVWPYLSHA